MASTARIDWKRVIIATLVAGIVVNLANWLMHGLILGDTYVRYADVFSQEPANPLHFFVVAITIAFFFTILFAKTRHCWAAGAKGGMVYGFWLGMVAYFAGFYDPLVIDGFPYFLAWCQGGTNLIGSIIGGAIVGVIVKPAAGG